MHSSAEIGVGVCIGQAAFDIPVRCDIITYLPGSANIEIAPSPFATNIRATRVLRGIQNLYLYAR
jgi:hypothetical protein